MTIHTETHWITDAEEMLIATQDKADVLFNYYSSPEAYAANSIDNEYRLPYEFLEEILRVRKPT